MKVKHWQGVPGIFGLNAAPVLEFYYFFLRQVIRDNIVPGRK